MKKLKEHGQHLYQRYEKFIPAVSFAAGIVVDIVTLGRIDSLLSLVQQALYLIMILALLCVEVRETRAKITIKNANLARLWHYREEAVHFLLGSLLSLFTLFYFRSSSLMSSFVFLMIIAACLVANEFSAVRKLGLALRTTLFCLCLTSYLSCLVPIVWHSIGFWQFSTALLLSLLSFTLVYGLVLRRLAEPALLRRYVARPYLAVLAAFLGLYFLHLLPPIPMSLTHVGIYRSVERVDAGYRVSYTKPFWRFWEAGDQNFHFRKGERIYCFFSIFSPVGFRDDVKVRWLYKDNRHGWQSSDAVNVSITGGSDRGWRGYSFKSNYQAGEWQVRIETSDEREIGRIYVHVEPDDHESGERQLHSKVI